jgi:uncharacterized protein (AIM24 family)
VAHFEVLDEQGLQSVRLTLEDESIRAEAGALATLRGEIRIESPLPTPLAWMRSALSEESVFRPRYTGTGVLELESSLGGFHVFEVADGEGWILEPGSYWASEASVELGIHRERAWTSLWAGRGFIDYRTRVRGHGKVALATSGPVEELTLENDRYWAQGPYVIARTEGLAYSLERPTKSFLRSFTTQERLIRGYQGTGRILVCTVPFWRYVLATKRPGDAAYGPTTLE